MNKMDLLQNLNDIGEDMLREAEPGEIRKKSRRWLPAAAAVFCALLIGALVWENRTDQRTKEPDGAETPAAVLYQDGNVTVRTIGKLIPHAVRSEACLVWHSERELFENCDVLLRARLVNIQNISITYRADGSVSEACILTLEPVTVIRGSLKQGDRIRLFTNRYVNTSLEDLNYSLRTAQIGGEGIVMLYENRIGGYPAELSDYSAGDNQRFAIWEGEAGKLLYDEQSYAGLTGCGSLDEAEDYIRSVLGNDDPAPADFEFSLRFVHRDRGENGEWPEQVSCWSFNSRSGVFSYEGSSYETKEYGEENLSAWLGFGQDFLDQAYRCIRRLDDLSVSEDVRTDGSKSTVTVEISSRADRKEKKLRWYGNDSVPMDPLLQQTVTELRNELEKLPSMREWEAKLSKIAAERRTERAQLAAAVLEDAFEKKYGPGNAPGYFRGTVIEETGHLSVILAPAENGSEKDRQIREIQNLLGEYADVVLFTQGE